MPHCGSSDAVASRHTSKFCGEPALHSGWGGFSNIVNVILYGMLDLLDQVYWNRNFMGIQTTHSLDEKAQGVHRSGLSVDRNFNILLVR